MVILAGALLLTLPISSATGEWTPFVDALFTATTSTCVTGLVVVPTVTAWSTFGHIVILMLIQIGGLGVITVMAGFATAFHKRIGLSERLLLQDSFNLDTLSGLVKFVKKVIKGTFIVEGIGALLYMTVFVPEYGLKGIWISIFNSVSAFCNAGLDIISETSLYAYATNPIINITTCLLIILGGIGFIVWWDVIRIVNARKNGKKIGLRNLTLHSKIAISTTLILISAGAVLYFIFEYGNPGTIGEFNLFQKIQASIFQSVTTRTAGFATIPQENLTNPSAIVSLILMFIGGSPVGTAGGIKTVTITVIVAYAIASVKNRNDVNLFNRTVARQSIGKAIAVMCMSFTIVFISTILLSAVTHAPALDVIYETVSATATVGLSRNLTGSLNTMGKIIITATMYFGRVGPVSLAVALNIKRENKNIIKNPVENIRIG